MGNAFYFSWEPAFIVALQTLMGRIGESFFSFVSVFGEEMLLVGILGYLYWCYDKALGEKIGLNIVAGNVLFPMIKNVALRRRPYLVHEEIRCLRPVEKDADLYDVAAQGWSFPSGHALNATVVYGSLAAYTKSRFLKVLGIVLPLLVGLSRVAVGVHYPTDVLCGWVVGLLLILLIPRLQSALDSRGRVFAVFASVGALGFFYCRTSDFFTSYGLMLGFFIGLAFEEKYVHFENTKKPLACVLRMIGGFAIYLGLNALLKLPFPADFLAQPTQPAFLIRTLRYTLVTFAAIGVYPLLFSRLKFLR